MPSHKTIVIAILCGYLALGAAYSLASPPFEVGDERLHYLYVKQIAIGKGIPVQDALGQNPAAQEASQPPLYYLLMSPVAALLDHEPLANTFKLNPHAQMGRPNATTNKNMIVHPEDERSRGPVHALLLMRWLSLLLGAGTIVATYLLARRALPHRPSIAIAAAALNATIPAFIFISASVSNDNLVILLGSLALVIAVDLSRFNPSTGKLLLFGIVAGLAALSKVSGLATLPLGIVALLLNPDLRREWRALAKSIALVVIPVVLLSAWWYARNVMLYGDLLGVDTMAAAAGARPPGFGMTQLWQEQEGFRWSVWAVFGGFNIIAGRWVYWIYDLLMLASAIGLAVWLVKRIAAFRDGVHRTNQGPIALAVFWLLILTAALAKWSLETMGSQGRLIYPAIGVIAIALVLGWNEIARSRSAVLAIVWVLLLALAAYLPFATVAPAYHHAIPTTAAAFQAVNPIWVSFGDQMTLAGYDVDRRAAQAGGTVRVRLQWRTDAPTDTDYSIFIHIYSQDGKIASQVDSYPGGGWFATSRISPNSIVDDQYDLMLPVTATPGPAQIAVGLYDVRTGLQLPARDGQGRPISAAVPLGSLNILPRATATESDTFPVHASLGGQIELAAVTTKTTATAGGEIEGKIFWRSVASISDDYVAFVHLIGQHGVAAQIDREPQEGQYPTSQWRSGDFVADIFTLQLPQVAPGEYHLTAGLYSKRTSQRLALQPGPFDRLVGKLRPRVWLDGPDSIELATIRVQ